MYQPKDSAGSVSIDDESFIETAPAMDRGPAVSARDPLSARGVELQYFSVSSLNFFPRSHSFLPISIIWSHRQVI